MSTDIVTLEIENKIATVSINRPDVHNAFNEEVISDLHETFKMLDEDQSIIAVILRGKGPSFSAGADLNWMKRAADFSKEENKADALKLAQMLQSLDRLSKTTIACVQGAAMGGGMGLTACCDIVLTLSTAKFALSEVRLGLIPATISPYVLKAIGPRHGRRYFQTGERFDGHIAKDIGLAHEVFENEEMMDAYLAEMIERLRKNGPQAMQTSKQLCHDIYGQEITDNLLDDTATRIAETRASSEAKEGLSAFLEKRKPAWAQST